MKSKEIKNIIFDLGGVVIDLDRNQAVEGLEELGIRNADSLLGVYGQKGPFLMLETGEIKEAEFFDLILSECKPGTGCAEIRAAFERFLVGLPVERLQTIGELRKKGYKVFILSNTNPLMYHHWIEDAFRQEGQSVNDYFDGIVVSFQENTCKPDPQIFLNLLNRYSIKADETVMLDDSEANCEAAKSVGMQAVRIMPEGEDSFKNVCSILLKEKR